MKVNFRKNINVGRVVTKVVIALIALYVGGTIVREIGTTMLCSYSPFYKGLTLIGWTVQDNVVPLTSGTCNTTGPVAGDAATYSGLITSVDGSGILAVIGIVAIASVVMEFVQVSM